MSAIDDSLLQELIIESKEHLGNIEPNLLALEKEGSQASPAIINEIFRAIHSIKGGFGFFGLKNIPNLSHAMESVLMQLRDGELVVTSTITDCLLAGIDRLRLLLDGVQESEAVSIEAEYVPLLQILGKEEGDQGGKPSSGRDGNQENKGIDLKLFSLSREEIKKYLAPGEDLYLIEIKIEEDVQDQNRTMEALLQVLRDTGTLLGSDPDLEAVAHFDTIVDQDRIVRMLHGSVMEKELLAASLNIAASRITVLNKQDFAAEPVATEVEGEKAKESAPKQSLPLQKKVEKQGGGDKKPAEASETIRVKVDLLNKLMTLAGELVLGRNQLKRVFERKIIDILAGSDTLSRYEMALERAKGNILEVFAATREGDSEGDDRERQARLIEDEFGAVQREFSRTMDFNINDIPGVATIVQNVDHVTSELQNDIMNTRMQPVGAVFSKFPRVIRDMAKKLNKSIELSLEGEEVELDKSIIEMLGDPLTHLIRNCADHAIEPPEVREAAGKPPAGKVQLRAYHEGGQVNISIIDDGAGINAAALRKKAVEKGFLAPEEAELLSERESLALIFAPGFSMAKVISDVSGRGVGMDVVKTNIEKLGGTVELESILGKRTRVNLRLPLTLAIIPSLIIKTEERVFAVPQVSLDELVRIRAVDTSRRIAEIHGKPVLRLREKLLPLVRLSELLELEKTFVDEESQRLPDRRCNLVDRRLLASAQDAGGEEKAAATPRFPLEPAEEGSCFHRAEDPQVKRRDDVGRRQSWRNSLHILVLKVGACRYGLIVDRLLNNEEIVVKPLSSYLAACKYYAGATIMGDGRVAMILDASGLADKAGLRFSGMENESTGRQANFDRRMLAEAQSLLLFNNGTAEKFALNLALVSRVEKVEQERIERVGEQEFLKYEDSSLRLLRLHDFLPIQKPRTVAEELFVIVPKLVKNPMGIVVAAIEDIIESGAGIDRQSVRGTGIHGSLIHKGQLLIMLNIYGLLEAAEPETKQSTGRNSSLLAKRVLLVEDTDFFQAVEQEYLEALGCLVDIAGNGQEAWEKLNHGNYDILVTDIVMPVMDGLDLIRLVRSSEAYRHLPIVALTSLVNEQDRNRIMAAGVNAYETKLDKEKLRQTMLALFDS